MMPKPPVGAAGPTASTAPAHDDHARCRCRPCRRFRRCRRHRVTRRAAAAAGGSPPRPCRRRRFPRPALPPTLLPLAPAFAPPRPPAAAPPSVPRPDAGPQAPPPSNTASAATATNDDGRGDIRDRASATFARPARAGQFAASVSAIAPGPAPSRRTAGARTACRRRPWPPGHRFHAGGPFLVVEQPVVPVDAVAADRRERPVPVHLAGQRRRQQPAA